MAIEFIPNQPILFTDNSQECLNNDIQQYAPMYAAGDRLYLQFKNTPCGDELICQPSELGSEELTNGSFTGSSTGWMLTDSWTYGANAITVNGSSQEVIYQSIVPSVRPYVVTVVVKNYVTGSLLVKFGETKVGYITSSGTHTFIVTPRQAGDFIIQNNPDNAVYTTVHLTIDNISVKKVYECIDWTTLYRTVDLVTNPSFDSDTAWTYENDWSISGGKLSKNPGTSQAAYQVVTTVKNRIGYKVRVVVSGRTAGSVDVIYGNITLGNISSNGTSEFIYPLPTIFDGTYDRQALVLLSDTSFDGDIEQFSIIDNQPIVEYSESGFCKSSQDVDAQIVVTTSSAYTTSIRTQTSLTNMQSGQMRIDYQTITDFVNQGFMHDSVGQFYDYIVDSLSTTKTHIYYWLSNDFVGCFTLDSAKEMNYGHSLFIADSTYTPISDVYDNGSLVDGLQYNNEYVTWSVDLSAVQIASVSTPLASGCYYIGLSNGCDPLGDPYFSNLISYFASNDQPCASKYISAYCDSEALGFDFTNFKLAHRARVLRIVPKYPFKGDEYVFSNGRNKLNTSDVEKVWQLWFDKVSEDMFDCISIQLACDTIQIDGVDYYAIPQDIEPDWAPNMRRNLAMLKVDLKKKVSKLFKRYC